MSSEKIAADIKALKKACRALVNITNQYVAHRNRTDEYPELPEQQIEENVNLVYALYPQVRQTLRRVRGGTERNRCRRDARPLLVCMGASRDACRKQRMKT